MAKKRVHEIAKELKDEHSIEFDNKTIVSELVSLGYDVKSHSSSLEDVEAIVAVRKIVEKHEAKLALAPAPLALPGGAVLQAPNEKRGPGPKRVHEIAKELKQQHGIEFDNKAIVAELKFMGFDHVASHSSLLEADQAAVAMQKIVEKRKPKPASAPAAPKGWVLRSVSPSTAVPLLPPARASATAPIADFANRAPAEQSAERAPRGVLGRLKVFIDGSNICHDFGLGVLEAVLAVLVGHGADRKKIDVVFDASFRHKLKGKDADVFEDGLKLGSWRQTAAGTSADAAIIARLRAYPSSVVVSNDTFRDHSKARGEFDGRRFRLDATEHDVVVHFPSSFGVAPVLQEISRGS